MAEKCAEVSVFLLEEYGCKEDKKGVEEQSSWQTVAPAVHGQYAEESAETLTLFRNEFGE